MTAIVDDFSVDLKSKGCDETDFCSDIRLHRQGSDKAGNDKRKDDSRNDGVPGAQGHALPYSVTFSTCSFDHS